MRVVVAGASGFVGRRLCPALEQAGLVEHLLAMITPRWVRTRTQPIGISDVVQYLVGVLEAPVPLLTPRASWRWSA